MASQDQTIKEDKEKAPEDSNETDLLLFEFVLGVYRRPDKKSPSDVETECRARLKKSGVCQIATGPRPAYGGRGPGALFKVWYPVSCKPQDKDKAAQVLKEQQDLLEKEGHIFVFGERTDDEYTVCHGRLHHMNKECSKCAPKKTA